MPLPQDEYVLSTHGIFFPAGKAFTTPGPGGFCGRQAKPAAGDAGWVNLGKLKMSKDKREATKLESFANTPGKRVRYNIKRVKKLLTHKFTCQEFSPLIVQLLFGTLPLDGTSTQFNQLEGSDVQGWLKIMRYDDNNALRMVVDSFVDLELTNEPDFGGEDFCTADLEAAVLHSTLNTGTL